MNTYVLKTRRKCSYDELFGVPLAVEMLFVFLAVLVSWRLFGGIVHADSFSDILRSSSFRGALGWVQKVDFIGGILQACISIGSIISAAFMMIQVMASFVYLSSKSIWEMVHEAKEGGSDTELYDLGMIGLAKNWAKGKSGTGLDAIVGFFLTIAPDVKRYSYFSDKAKNEKIKEDMTMGQFTLAIFLDVFISLFIVAMAFNGTLVKAWAISIDALGTLAEHCVSVNYAGYIDDLVAQGTGYKFTFSAYGTAEGDKKQQVASELYGKAISKTRGLSSAHYELMGKNIENIINGSGGPQSMDQHLANNNRFGQTFRGIIGAGRADAENAAKFDRQYATVGFDVRTNSSKGTDDTEVWTVSLKQITNGLDEMGIISDYGADEDVYFHVYFKPMQVTESQYFGTNAS